MPESIPKPRCGMCEHYRTKRDDGAPKTIKGYGWCRKKQQETSANQTMPITDCFELPKPHGWEPPQVAMVDVKSWAKVVSCHDCPCMKLNAPLRCQLANREWVIDPRVDGDPPPYWCPLRVGPAVIMLKEVDGG